MVLFKGSFLAIRLLLVLFLGFSSVLSSVAVPTTRSLKSSEENQSSVLQELLTQDRMDGEDQLLDMAGEYFNGRMVLENTDYEGTGANNRHNPKTPGRP